MATLHCNWLPADTTQMGQLFIWADIWSTTGEAGDASRHPFTPAIPDLLTLGAELQLPFPFPRHGSAPHPALTLPSYRQQKQALPFVAGQDPVAMKANYLHYREWQVEGIALTPDPSPTPVCRVTPRRRSPPPTGD